VTTHSAAERAALVEALRAAGPDAPTLCEGWTARDLAAHLVARERRPDSTPGLLVPALASWTEWVRKDIARRAYPDLLDRIAGGPPWTSLFALPGVDATVNLGEHFVHCEDVRRAAPSWAPRGIPDQRQLALWKLLGSRGELLLRKSPVPVTLATPDGRTIQARAGDGGVRLTGEPAELVLYAYGRGAHARVQVDGSTDALRRFEQVSFGV
jgi:uncharacterized protein (TIGR03085 family)